MSDALVSAYLKLGRARQHLTLLDAETKRFTESTTVVTAGGRAYVFSGSGRRLQMDRHEQEEVRGDNDDDDPDQEQTTTKGHRTGSVGCHICFPNVR